MKNIYWLLWAITRVQFIVLWSFAEPIGEASVWLRDKYVQRRDVIR